MTASTAASAQPLTRERRGRLSRRRSLTGRPGKPSGGVCTSFPSTSPAHHAAAGQTGGKDISEPEPEPEQDRDPEMARGAELHADHRRRTETGQGEASI